MTRYFWAPASGLFHDFNFQSETRSTYAYASTFYPLWAGLVTREQAAAVLANLSFFEEPGGVVMSRAESRAQWDYPYGWSPIQLIAAEGLRAFKRTTILGYEVPWNNFDFSYGAYVALEKRHLERKVAALARYASQQHRRYADPEYVWNLARVHGVNVNREYAECFQVYRLVA